MDHRSDLYSAGVIFYEAITGQVPFNAETFNELIFKIVLEIPAPPEQHVPGLDLAFSALIRQAMAREQSDAVPDRARVCRGPAGLVGGELPRARNGSRRAAPHASLGAGARSNPPALGPRWIAHAGPRGRRCPLAQKVQTHRHRAGAGRRSGGDHRRRHQIARSSRAFRGIPRGCLGEPARRASGATEGRSCRTCSPERACKPRRSSPRGLSANPAVLSPVIPSATVAPALKKVPLTGGKHPGANALVPTAPPPPSAIVPPTVPGRKIRTEL